MKEVDSEKPDLKTKIQFVLIIRLRCHIQFCGSWPTKTHTHSHRHMQPPFCLRRLYIENGIAAGSLPHYNHHPPPATADTQTLNPTQKSHTLITANDCSALARAATPALKLVELPHLGNKERGWRGLCLWAQQLKRSMEEGDVKKGISREYKWWPRCVFVRPWGNNTLSSLHLSAGEMF